MIRDVIYRDVSHQFDLQDLQPVERRMVDAVIDATVDAVVRQLEADADEIDDIRTIAFRDAARQVETYRRKR